MSRSPRSSLSSNAEGRDSQDPLSKALQPPPNESEEDRTNRLQLLRAAEQISREIDASIAESKKEWERRKKAIKILLLGTVWRSRTLGSVWHGLMDYRRVVNTVTRAI
jgi:hypothetical protein